MKIIKTHFLVFLTTIWIFFTPKIALGITYNILAPLPGVDTSGNLVPYLVSMLTFVIGIAGILGVIRLVICGFSLLLAPGASQREHAKECLWKIVLGLLLAVSAFVLLRSINPTLVTPIFTAPNTPSVEGVSSSLGNGADCPAGSRCEWRNDASGCAFLPQCRQQRGQVRSQGQPTACTGTPLGTCCVYTPYTCPTCPTITAPVSNGNRAAAVMTTRINNAWSSWTTSGGTLPWRVTEALPNTSPHCSNEEVMGESVDIAFNITAGRMITLLSASDRTQLAQNLNLFVSLIGGRADYEVATQADRDAIVAAGYTGTIRVFPWITGAHFSIYP